MDNKSKPKARATALPPPRNGKREGEDEDEKQVSAKKQRKDNVAEERKNKKQVSAKKQRRDNVAEELKNKDGATEVPPPVNVGKREGDNDNEKQASAKKQKRDEIAEEQKNKEEIVSDYSSLDSESEKPITLATPREQNAASKTICAKNLSHSVERADLENLFKDCGEIVDVRLHTDEEGIFRCFGHVEFATAEAAQKALELNNTELLRCRIRVVIAQEKTKYTPYKSFHDSNFSNLSNSFQRSEIIQPMKGSEILENCKPKIVDKASQTIQENPNLLSTQKEQSATSKTICAKNLAYSVQQADVENLFKECGEIVNIHLHTDHEGRFKGYGYVKFATTEAAQNALELHYTELLGRRIRVCIAQEKGEYTSSRSNWRNSFQKSERIQPMKGTDNLQYHGEEIDEKASKIPWESPKILATLKEQNAASKTIYVRNLSYRVEQADMENLFRECGEIVEIRLHSNREGRLNGFGHVEFAMAESAQKALELDNTEFLGRFIRVGIVREKSEYAYNRSNWRNSVQNSETIQPIKGTSNSEDCEEEFKEKASKTPQESPKTLPTPKEQNAASKTIYVTNLSYGVVPDDLGKHFKECGEIAYVRLHTNHEGRLKGSGHVQFATTEAAQKALQLDNTELLRRPIRVGLTREKGEYSHNRR